LISLNPSINGRIVTDTVLSAVTTLLGLDREDSWQAQEDGGYPLRFVCFDLLMLDGHNLMDDPYWKRRELLGQLIEILKANSKIPDFFDITPICHGGKEAKMKFYSEVVGKGCDGIILKPLDSKYYPLEARQGSAGWVKYKVKMSEALGHDIDAFVSGYELGDEDKAYKDLIGTLKLSVYLVPSGKEHHIASISGIPLELRKKITVFGEQGIPTLHPSFYNQVCVIDGQDMSSRSMRFMHARLIRFRSDKQKWDCKFEERELANSIL
jgi:ATP-dependent DNA ligase